MIFFLSGLFCVGSHAQNISGLVLDKETNEPIPYASVYLASFKNGIYASESGRFRLNYDSPNDTVIFSAIGYVSYKDKIANLKSNRNIIYLDPNTIELDEVVVTPAKKKKKTMRIGAHNSRQKQWWGSAAGMKTDGSFSFNVEHYLFIDGINIPVRIKKIIVGCSKKEERLEAVFRVRLYTKNKETDEPDQLVNKKDIVKSFTRIKSKKITFDVETENLILPPEGLFVSAEHIGYNLNELVDDSLLNKYNILNVKNANSEISWLRVKSKNGAIAGTKLQGKYYLPIKGNEIYYQMEKQKYNIFIQLEVEEL
ncbi:MAG: carboxypeptidase-like regulatory domain-containing protein [Tannerella sp.]|nr:carboxypeptidase-like regulatory domain-containing protein [Tannerella sp.]